MFSLSHFAIYSSVYQSAEPDFQKMFLVLHHSSLFKTMYKNSYIHIQNTGGNSNTSNFYPFSHKRTFSSTYLVDTEKLPIRLDDLVIND